VVADILWCMAAQGHDVVPVGFVDDDAALKGQTFLGLPVWGTTAQLSDIPHDAVVAAIGSGRIRQRLFAELRAAGEQFITVCHPTAVIAPDVQIGVGSMIAANVVVNTGSVIGENVILNTACTVDHHNRIGDYAHIAPGVHLAGGVQVGEGSLIGIGATVLPQTQVGKWCTIGAGSVVIKNVGDGETAVGNPARVIKRADE
jgi:sugar O-acyltransferase (sialic acid O-acetyltransferase NeuD family)